MTIARQVEAWYAERKDYLSKLFPKVQIGSVEPDHPGGKIGIAIEGPATVVTISIFNSGLITQSAPQPIFTDDIRQNTRSLDSVKRSALRIVSLRSG
jgi:energy-converting hydrogenase Eha subunit F